MHSTSRQRSLMSDRERFRYRAAAILLALAVHALLLVLLLRQAQPLPLKIERQPTTFQLMPEPKIVAGTKKAVAKTKHPRTAKQSPAPSPPREAVAATPSQPVPPFLILSRQQLAASDIAALPSHKVQPDSGGAGENSGAVSGPGEGPGGARLYNAEWYRRPTDAELAGYLPAGAPRKGWGLVACKTVENYHVENCQSLGESPLGSGLARAIREAAWQFLVLPPRIDGRPMIGAWVRIRIDYTQGVPG